MKDKITFFPLSPEEQVGDLYEGKINPWYIEKMRSLGFTDNDIEHKIRKAMSEAIQLTRAQKFKIGDMVGHPTLSKATAIISIDKEQRFAEVLDSDTKKVKEVNCSELFNPKIFLQLLK